MTMKKIMTRSSAGLRALTPFLALTLLLACDSDDNAEPSQVPVIGDDDDAGSSEPTDQGESSDGTEDTDEPTDDTEDTDEPTDDTEDTDEPTDDTEDTDSTDEPTDSSDDTGQTDGTDDTGETENTDEPTDDTGQTDDTDEPTDDTESTDTVSSTDDPDSGTPVVPEECVENADTCVSCPSEAEDFAIQCSDSECAPFDNVARLGRYVEGAPLEEVP
jgi:hypothetical protein